MTWAWARQCLRSGQGCHSPLPGWGHTAGCFWGGRTCRGGQYVADILDSQLQTRLEGNMMSLLPCLLLWAQDPEGPSRDSGCLWGRDDRPGRPGVQEQTALPYCSLSPGRRRRSVCPQRGLHRKHPKSYFKEPSLEYMCAAIFWVCGMKRK